MVRFINFLNPRSLGETMADGKKAAASQPSGGDKVLAIIAYLLGIFGFLLYFVADRKNKFLRFHSIQATLFSIEVFVVVFVVGLFAFIPGAAPIIGLLDLLIMLVYLIYWLYILYKVVVGELYKAWLVGAWADKWSS